MADILAVVRVVFCQFPKCVLVHIRIKDEVAPCYMLKPSSKNILLTVQRRCFFRGSFLLFMFCICHAFLSVHCSLVITCWERAYLLALLCVMFYCVFVTFPCGVLGQVWYLIVSISDLCLLAYLEWHICYVQVF